MGSKVGVIMAARMKADIMAIFLLLASHLEVIIPNLARKVVTTGISKASPIASSSLDTIEI